MYSDHNTDWAPSAKGNVWRRINGVVLVVGRSKTDSKYWAMRDGNFLKESYVSESVAKRAAENGAWIDAALRELDGGEWEL
jgi:hypothetical protein